MLRQGASGQLHALMFEVADFERPALTPPGPAAAAAELQARYRTETIYFLFLVL